MAECIWDGKMDCGWEELSQLLIKTCGNFTETMLETTAFSPIKESRVLISSECMERFKSITGLLADHIKDGTYYQYEDLTNESQNAIKLNSWILLGSLTETTLQMFLAFYLDDYKKTRWQQWENFNVQQVQTPIVDCIQRLVDGGMLEAAHGRSLKKAIKETIKEHTRERYYSQLIHI